jgi:hypothetical protein
MGEFEYMETLYTLATAKLSEAEKTKQVIAKIDKSAAASEPATSGVSQERVAHKRPENATLRDAYKAAKAGQVWE